MKVQMIVQANLLAQKQKGYRELKAARENHFRLSILWNDCNGDTYVPWWCHMPTVV